MMPKAVEAIIYEIMDEFNLQPLLDIAEGKRPLDDDWNEEVTRLHYWLQTDLIRLTRECLKK